MDGRNGTAQILVLTKFRRILECFTVTTPALSLPELTQATGLPPSTCRRLVRTLVDEGFLERHADGYRIGLALVRCAAPGQRRLDLVQIASPVLRELRDNTGETACLYVRDRAFRTVVALAETHNVVVRIFTVGMVTVLHAGSAGKVFMAFDPAARRAAVHHGLTRETPQTLVDIDDIDRELAVIRSTGFAASFEERDQGAASVSAPVFGPGTDLVAVVGIVAPIQRLTQEQVPTVVPAVLAAAAASSRKLGHIVVQ